MLLFKMYPFFNTSKNVRKQYENNKLKIIAPAWNDELELPHGFFPVSHIQDNFEYIIKNMKHSQQFFLFMFTSIALIID